MANEISYALISDLRVAQVLSGDYLQLIADRQALPNHPALHYWGDFFGRGSNQAKIPHDSLPGYDSLVLTADGAAVANSAFVDGSTTLSVARYSKAYAPTDLAQFTSPSGEFTPARFAEDSVLSSALNLTDLIANLVGGFSNTVGTSGADFSLANWLAALSALEISCQGAIMPGSVMAVLHSVQVGDLRTAIGTTSGGAIQWMQPSQDQMIIRGNGYRGQYMGVDIFSSSRVPTANAGADRGGGMFVNGAIVWGDMSVQADGADQLVIGNKVLFERDRTAAAGVTQYVTHAYQGASEGIDGYGVSIITDA